MGNHSSFGDSEDVLDQQVGKKERTKRFGFGNTCEIPPISKDLSNITGNDEDFSLEDDFHESLYANKEQDSFSPRLENGISSAVAEYSIKRAGGRPGEWFFLNGKRKAVPIGGKLIIQIEPEKEKDRIPQLCYHEDIQCFKDSSGWNSQNKSSRCGLCKVLVRSPEHGDYYFVLRGGSGKIVSANSIDHGTDRLDDSTLRFDYVRSCVTEVKDGISIYTHAFRDRKNFQFQQAIRTFLRKKIIEKLTKLKKEHPELSNCETCFLEKERCELFNLFRRFLPEFGKYMHYQKIQEDVIPKKMKKKRNVMRNNCLSFDPDYCVSCARCVRGCQLFSILNEIKYFQPSNEANQLIDLESNSSVVDIEDQMKDFKFHEKMFTKNGNLCVSCGTCSSVCPTSAITETRDDLKVSSLLFSEAQTSKNKNQKKVMVALVSPSILSTFFEEFFGIYYDSSIFEKREQVLVYLLRRIGFDYVFDLSHGMDLYSIELTQEFLERMRNSEKEGAFPMISNYCPSTVQIIRKFYPKFLTHLSTCKTPQLILGEIVKSYYARELGLDPKNIVVVSLQSCVSKKEEINAQKVRNVDFVLTVREIIRILKKRKNAFQQFSNLQKSSFLKDQEYDDLFSVIDLKKRKQRENRASGAGLVFGRPGGIVESFLRILKSSYDQGVLNNGISFNNVMSGNLSLERTNIVFGRGKEKEIATIMMHSMDNIIKFLDRNSGTHDEPTFIESMSCFGGCLFSGGGNPKLVSPGKNYRKGRKKRRKTRGGDDGVFSRSHNLRRERFRWAEKFSEMKYQSLKYGSILRTESSKTMYELLGSEKKKMFFRLENGYFEDTETRRNVERMKRKNFEMVEAANEILDSDEEEEEMEEEEEVFETLRQRHERDESPFKKYTSSDFATTSNETEEEEGERC